MARTPPGRTRARVLAFVRASLERGRSPSIREVQAAVGLRTPEGTRQHLLRLVEDGQLARAEGARGWCLPDSATTHVRYVPLLGRVPAGDPTEAVEEREGVIAIEARRVRGSSGQGSSLRGRGSSLRGQGSSLREQDSPLREQVFALRVQGESMRDAGILSGDVVIVDPRAEARHQDIVVARLDDDATVKRLWIGKGRVELRPENPDFRPIVPAPGEELQILGKVIEVRRYFTTSGA